MREKTDKELGYEVRNHLIEMGIETPTLKDPNVKAAKVAAINGIHDMMFYMGLDLEDDSLIGTPERFADMMIDEFFYGLNYDNFPKCTAVQNKMKTNEMVLVGPTTTMSICEHHLVTIDGLTWVSYIPKDNVLGLSKISRIVNFFAKRPQIQERMTEQIHAAISFVTKSEDVAVMQKAVHYCMKARGVQDITASTTTTKVSGRFMTNDSLKAEFINACK